MNRFKVHTEESATPSAAGLLRGVKEAAGFVPNVFAVIAESAPALQAFVGLNTQLAQSSLSVTERELVQIATSVENQCSYCVAGHTAFAAMQEISPEVVEAVRNELPIPDARLEALHRFTRCMVHQRGPIPEAEIEAFFAAGYSPAQLLEVILGICVKTFSNLANSAIGIPLDDEFSSYAWVPNTNQPKTNVSQAA
jgi:uncharacterized peroxidase-related enzyme